MLDPGQKEVFQKRFAVLRVIPFSMFSGILVMAAAVHMVIGSSRPAALPWGDSLRYGGYGLAGALAAAAFLLRGALLSPQALKASAAKGLESVLSAAQSRVIILLAMSEAVAIIGAVQGVILRETGPLYNLLAVSFFLFANLWPRQTAWQDLMISALNAADPASFGQVL